MDHPCLSFREHILSCHTLDLNLVWQLLRLSLCLSSDCRSSESQDNVEDALKATCGVPSLKGQSAWNPIKNSEANCGRECDWGATGYWLQLKSKPGDRIQRSQVLQAYPSVIRHLWAWLDSHFRRVLWLHHKRLSEEAIVASRDL